MTILEQVVMSSTKKRPSTKKAYVAAVRSFVTFAGSSPSNWTGFSVERWRDELLASGLAGQTVNCKLAAIKFASKRLDLLGLGPPFAQAAEFCAVIKERKRFAPSIERGKKLVEGCGGTAPISVRDRAIVILALRTGCRREGLAQLQRSDVEPGATAITVVIKGGRRHKIHLDHEARDALLKWMSWLSASPRKISDGAVFRSLRQRINGSWTVGDKLHPSSINLIFKKRAERGDAGHWFPHLARHAFASWADDAGVARTRIASVTGHTTLDGLTPYLSDSRAEEDPVGAHLPSLLTLPGWR